MKKVSLLFALILMTTFAKAQDANYQKAMGQAMDQFSKAKSPEDFTEAANSFSRIAAAQDSLYLPDYYAAYVQTIESFRLKDADKRDKIIAEAQKHIDRAAQLSPNNSEVEVMNGYALMAKMVVDPASRGQEYSARIMQSFSKAMTMNPHNPRATIMMARMQLGAAQFFGSSTDEACKLAKKGKALLDKEMPLGFAPHWGEHEVNAILKNCDN